MVDNMATPEEFTPHELDTIVSQLEKPEFEQAIDPDNMEAFLTELGETLQDPAANRIWEKVEKTRLFIHVSVNYDGPITVLQIPRTLDSPVDWEQHNPNRGLQLQYKSFLSDNFEFLKRDDETGYNSSILTITPRDFGNPAFNLTQFINSSLGLKLIRIGKVEKYEDRYFNRTTIYFLFKS